MQVVEFGGVDGLNGKNELRPNPTLSLIGSETQTLDLKSQVGRSFKKLPPLLVGTHHQPIHSLIGDKKVSL